jgi:hypothetical protein
MPVASIWSPPKHSSCTLCTMQSAAVPHSSNESERVTRTREKGNAMLDDVALMDIAKDSYVKPFLT